MLKTINETMRVEDEKREAQISYQEQPPSLAQTGLTTVEDTVHGHSAQN